jgi:hypothetical protein
MTRKSMVRSFLLSTVAPAVIAAASMATTSPALAQCAGPGTKTSQGGTPQTTCVSAIPISPGNPLRWDSSVRPHADGVMHGPASLKQLNTLLAPTTPPMGG